MKNKNFTFNSGKAREYFLEKISFEISPWELKKHSEEKINALNIIDVRDYDDYISGHIPFAIHIPMGEIEEHTKMFEKDIVNIVYGYCPCCIRASQAASIIADNNHPVMTLCGGFKAWKELNFDTVKTGDIQ